MSLDSLFHHILLSEQEAEEKRRRLLEVKAEIDWYQEKHKTLMEELECAKMKVEEKTRILSETALQCGLLRMHKEATEKQKADLSKQKHNLIESLGEIRQKCSEEQEKFMKEIMAFNDDYSLLTDREAIMESRTKAEILKLEEEETFLIKEMECMEQKNIQLNALQSEKSSLQLQMVELEDKTKVLEKNLNEAITFTETLKAEKLKIHQKPETDDFCLKLQRELKFYKEQNLESVREALCSEIHFLQMKLAQKGIQF
uniref:Coiled-coil domain-containing protein 172 n=1 Tax=Lepisosteus oculatus TaxID=7918 RepID=W5N5N8_LEPOC